MCGIFGYVGLQKAAKLVLDGLKKMEYRGYDSAGIGGILNNKILYCKEVGKIAALEKEIEKMPEFEEVNLAIAQTRWATHGKPNKINAHPHFNQNHTLALVHNGIIENHDSLRQSLKKKGVTFISDTDTEVIAHLIGSVYEGDLLKAIQEVIPLLKGSFAVALIHEDFPDQIVAFAHELPLIIGVGLNETFLASDANAFANYTREVIYLSNSEIAIIKANKLELFHTSLGKITKKK